MTKRSLLLAIITIISILGINSSANAQHCRLNNRDLGYLIDRIETGADRYRRSLDYALDRSNLDGSRREDNINQFVRDFERATDRLRNNARSNRASAYDVEEVLGRAVRINNFMYRHRLDSRAQNDWANLRRDLDQLARAYTIAWRWDRDYRYDRRGDYRDNDYYRNSSRRDGYYRY